MASDSADVTSSGKSFQVCGPATRNAKVCPGQRMSPVMKLLVLLKSRV